MTNLRFRQIHLDFHTSEHIPGIGAHFDPAEFVDTLEKARVDSITCFARCHHGWIYYNTEVLPERRHPHLTPNLNLLKEQIEACHARGIRAPIYTTIQWDHLTATQHPEWLVVDETGRPIGTPLYEAGFYRQLCVNTPYVDTLLKPHIEEMLQTLPVDGFFFDIVKLQDCSCLSCRTKMETAGLDPANAETRRQFGIDSINAFCEYLTGFVRQFNQDCTIFYNAGHIGPRHRPIANAYTHFEVELLPSGHWGYLHFPIVVRYARTLGLDYMGHTGKFHTAWGDFHSFKNPAALQYECFRMLAHGSKCLIGDQLPPRGRIEPHVYSLIGSVYSQVEAKEPWCVAAKPVTEIAVFTPEEFLDTQHLIDRHGELAPSLMGVTRMLEESAHQFDIIDTAAELSGYKLLVLPDNIPVSPAFADKLDTFLANDGALIASFEFGLNDDKSEFALDALGVSLTGEGVRTPDGRLVRGRHFEQGDYVDYLLPGEEIGAGLPPTEHVMYIRGTEIEAQSGSTVLAQTVNPYFDRTYAHFCSHRQTPSSGEAGGPGIVQKGKAIFFAHPIFSQYSQNAPRWCKTLFQNALNILLPQPLVRHSGPSTIEVTLTGQAAENRWIVHLLHYIPQRRGQDFDIIEDVIPVYYVTVSVNVPEPVSRVVCVPEQDSLAFKEQAGRVEFVLPKLNGHQMIALEFGG